MNTSFDNKTAITIKLNFIHKTKTEQPFITKLRIFFNYVTAIEVKETEPFTFMSNGEMSVSFKSIIIQVSRGLGSCYSC